MENQNIKLLTSKEIIIKTLEGVIKCLQHEDEYNVEVEHYDCIDDLRDCADRLECIRK